MIEIPFHNHGQCDHCWDEHDVCVHCQASKSLPPASGTPEELAVMQAKVAIDELQQCLAEAVALVSRQATEISRLRIACGPSEMIEGDYATPGDLIGRLRELADAVTACEWELPIDAKETCLRAAYEIEQLRLDALTHRSIPADEFRKLLKPFVETTQMRLLLTEAREAFRTGYSSDLVPCLRLLYLSDRWDEQAKEVIGG